MQIVASGLMLLWLVYHIDQHVWAVLSSISFFAFMISLLVFAMTQFFGAWRLYLLLGHSDHIKLMELVFLTFSSFFFSNFLPGTIGGDVYKGINLVYWGINRGKVVFCLFTDRFVNTLSIFFVSLIVIPSSSISKAHFSSNLLLTIGFVCTSILLCFVASIIFRAKLGYRIHKWLDGVVLQVRVWKQCPNVSLMVVALSILSFGCSVLSQILLCKALRIVVVQPIDFTAVICIIFFVTLLPISLNGIGFQEISYTYLLSSLGVDEASALSVAILSRCLILGTSLFGGGIIIAHKHGYGAKHPDMGK